MKAIAVHPGKPNSIHLAEFPKPSLMQTLTEAKGAIKVYCEVAPLE